MNGRDAEIDRERERNKQDFDQKEKKNTPRRVALRGWTYPKQESRVISLYQSGWLRPGGCGLLDLGQV